MKKAGFWGNPIRRHYLIIFGVFLPGVFGGVVVADTLGGNPVLGMVIAAIIAWALMFWSGHCQHCDARIPQTRFFDWPADHMPTNCDKCGENYSEKAESE